MTGRKLTALWTLDPDKAANVCRAAIKRAHGNFTEAAAALEVARTTLTRWAKEHPEIIDREDLFRLREKAREA